MKVFVLLYEGDVVGVYETAHDAERAARDAGSDKYNPWRIDETTFYKEQK